MAGQKLYSLSLPPLVILVLVDVRVVHESAVAARLFLLLLLLLLVRSPHRRPLREVVKGIVGGGHLLGVVLEQVVQCVLQTTWQS
jgi:hypothetical protein